jgi:hypothetical protein
MRLLITFLVCFIANIYMCQGQRGFTSAQGARSVAMANTGSTMLGIEAILNNQAGLYKLNGIGVIAATEQRFLLEELNAISFGLAYGNNSLGAVGLMVSNFGFDEYREQKIGLAYSRKLFDNLSIGGQLDLLHVNIAGYGSSSNLTFELGAITDITKEVSIGFHVFSPSEINITDQATVPTKIILGVAYKPSKKIQIVTEVEKIVDRDYTFRMGVDYAIVDALSLRAGYGTGPAMLSFGLGYNINKKLSFDGSFTNHETLGITPSGSLIYQGNKP